METESRVKIVYNRQDLHLEVRELTNQLKRHRAARFGPGKSSGLYDRFILLVPDPDPVLLNWLDNCIFCDIEEGLPIENIEVTKSIQFLIDYLTTCYL